MTPLISYKNAEEQKSKITEENKGKSVDPNWLTGFADPESSFIVSIYKAIDRKSGWRVNPIFSITLHGKDIALLHRILSFFGVGTINISKEDGSAIYTVKSIKDLTNVILPHFLKYPLITTHKNEQTFFYSNQLFNEWW